METSLYDIWLDLICKALMLIDDKATICDDLIRKFFIGGTWRDVESYKQMSRKLTYSLEFCQ